MNEEEAKVYFAKSLVRGCSCGAKEGELCQSPAFWVHLDRVLDHEPGGPAKEWPDRVRPLPEKAE